MVLLAIRIAVLVGLPVLVLFYAGWRLVRYLEDRDALGPGLDPDLLERMRSARLIVERIQARLPAWGGQPGGAIGAELEELVTRRLPSALDRQKRLVEYLAGRSRADLVKEERELRRKLGGARDEELRKLLQRNHDLVQGRLESYDRLGLTCQKADAQIRAVLLNLESLEDGLVAREFATVEGADHAIENLVEDVKLLESAYEDIDLE